MKKYERRFGHIAVRDNYGWPAKPALCVLDCVLSLNRRYDKVVFPRVERFSQHDPEVMDLSHLQARLDKHEVGDFFRQSLDYNDVRREQTLRGVVKYLLAAQAKQTGESEWERLRAWATPTFGIGAPAEERPDVGVRDWLPADGQQAAATELPSPTPDTAAEEPDQEIAVATLQGEPALLIERRGLLVAALELVSPRNKDRPAACAAYASTYVGYLLKGIHLLLVDVHRRPLQFSFADQIASELRLDQSACPAPFALAYRVGEPAPGGGRFLAVWRRPLTVGSPLPPLRLPLSVQESVLVDLEATYTRAAAAAYLG